MGTQEFKGSMLPIASNLEPQHAFSWREVILNLLCTMSVFISMAIIPPTLDVLVRQRFAEIEGAVQQFTLYHSLPQLLLIGIIAGFFSDRIGRRYALIIPCTILSGVLTACIPHVENFNLLLAVRIVDGAVGIVTLGLVLAKMLDLSALHPDRKGQIMALYGGCIPASYLIGNLMTFALAPYGEALIYAIAGVLVVATGAALCVVAVQNESIRATHGGVVQFFQSFTHAPRIWNALLFGFADKFVIASVVILTGRALADVYQKEGSQTAGLVLSLYFLGFMIFSRLATHCIQRFTPTTTLYIATMIHGFVLFALPHADFNGFCILMAIAGVLTPFEFIACLALLSERSTTSEYGTNAQLFSFVGSLGLIIGIPIFVALAKADPTLKLAYLVSGLSQVLVVWVGLIVMGWQRFRLYQVERTSI